MNVFEEIQYIVAGVIGADREKITRDSRLVEDLDADSLDQVELVMGIEEFFGIMVDDEKLESIKTVGVIETCVNSHLADRVEG